MTPAEAMQLDDKKFEAVFRQVSQQEIDALAEPQRGVWFDRVKGATPHVNASVKRLERTQAKTEAKLARFPRVDFDDIQIGTTSDYLLKGILHRGMNVEIYGPSGDGKTFFTVDMLLHVACGIPWRDKLVKPALVVYVAAEAGASIARRFVAWRREKLGESREGRTPFVILTRGPNIMNAVEVADLMADLRAIAEDFGMPIGLIAFDTLSRSAPGSDENSPSDMSRIVGVADHIRAEIGAATLFVHHSGKDVSKGGRGHTALLGACDSIICVVDKVATLEKSRDGASGESFPFELTIVDLGLDEDNEAITTCVIEPTTSETKLREVKLTDAEQIAIAALKESIANFGQVMPQTSAIPGGMRAVSIETWRTTFYRLYGEDRSDDAAKKAFNRAKIKLIATKLAGVSTPWAWAWW